MRWVELGSRIFKSLDVPWATNSHTESHIRGLKDLGDLGLSTSSVPYEGGRVAPSPFFPPFFSTSVLLSLRLDTRSRSPTFLLPLLSFPPFLHPDPLSFFPYFLSDLPSFLPSPLSLQPFLLPPSQPLAPPPSYLSYPPSTPPSLRPSLPPTRRALSGDTQPPSKSGGGERAGKGRRPHH